MPVSNTKQAEFNEKIIFTCGVIFILIFLLTWKVFSQGSTLNNVARNSQEKFDSIEQRFDTTERSISRIDSRGSEYSTIEYTDKRTEILRENYYEFYEEFTDFVKKAESRLPILRKI